MQIVIATKDKFTEDQILDIDCVAPGLPIYDQYNCQIGKIGNTQIINGNVIADIPERDYTGLNFSLSFSTDYYSGDLVLQCALLTPVGLP